MNWYGDFDSSMVNRIGYDPDTREVHVEFKDKKGNPTSTWAYWPVDASDFEIIRTAPSVGKAVNAWLKGGVYNSRKVGA